MTFTSRTRTRVSAPRCGEYSLLCIGGVLYVHAGEERFRLLDFGPDAIGMATQRDELRVVSLRLLLISTRQVVDGTLSPKPCKPLVRRCLGSHPETRGDQKSASPTFFMNMVR